MILSLILSDLLIDFNYALISKTGILLPHFSGTFLAQIIRDGKILLHLLKKMLRLSLFAIT